MSGRSWLSAAISCSVDVEGYFAKLSKQRLKRGVFRSVVESTGRNQPLRRRDQCRTYALRVDRRPQQNYRRGHAHEGDVNFPPNSEIERPACGSGTIRQILTTSPAAS